MAREGSGHAQFITDSDRMQPKVMQSLRFALQPAVVNISVDWILPDGVTVDTLSPPISVLFQGQRTLIYAQLKGESSGGSEGTVSVKYSLKDQPVTNQLHFCLKPTEETGLSIHRLAARTLIRSLEQEERSGAAGVEGIRSRIVELSVQAGVSSVHTAFIAVNKDSRQTVKGPLLQRRVPTYVPLKSISVEVLVQDHVATVSSTLQYVNEEERPLEALFVLPLPADAAVCHFSAKIGEQEIVAEVQDRETTPLDGREEEEVKERKEAKRVKEKRKSKKWWWRLRSFFRAAKKQSPESSSGQEEEEQQQDEGEKRKVAWAGRSSDGYLQNSIALSVF
ncbi:von Willebrand factor A domain-containing protein 5A-like isoform X3 [Onychostoma macrolepis]|uniref:von Willebrand factor A domain-containing protein 5A-like isoform X3 n=1 Tax=Onychostoma macrolepis TaxID=369639 RepID=UPI00272DAB37|nr:von Willebrand factor A domain-containing protein 5A-like isoform X3 [Onychostoma macrolepis]